jgi:4-diphosphocytidyl-2-C-methyl-D-erythritol kinase
VLVRVPAKVNLALHVGAPAPDGYHQLATVFQALDLYDEVRALPAPAGELSVTTLGTDSSQEPVPDGPENLAWRAAAALAERAGIDAGVRLEVTKRIPVAAGMAGGSADAAAALLACEHLWGVRVQPDERAALAAGLGADVPFALLGRTALGLGRGDRVCPLPDRGRYRWVVAVTHQGLSTPAVYREVDHLRGTSPVPEPAVADALLQALASGDVAAVAAGLTNDMQPAALALRPELGEVLAAGEDAGALAAMVSGSGPTCVFLLDPASATAPADTQGVAEAVRRCPGVREVVLADAPVAGAHVVVGA